jgi:hypothetical protein
MWASFKKRKKKREGVHVYREAAKDGGLGRPEDDLCARGRTGVTSPGTMTSQAVVETYQVP